MKKLKLNLGFVREELSKEEMKKINGGFTGYCDATCYGYCLGSAECANDNLCLWCINDAESGFCGTPYQAWEAGC